MLVVDVDRGPIRGNGDGHGLRDLLEVEQAGALLKAGKDEYVDDEVAVVDLFANVAAVGKAGLAVEGVLADAVFDPLPDGAARGCLVQAGGFGQYGTGGSPSGGVGWVPSRFRLG